MRTHPVGVVGVLLVFVLATGCQSPPLASNSNDSSSNNAVSATHREHAPVKSDIKKMILKYVKQQPKGDPPQWSEPQKISHPGIWPFQNRRKFVVEHQRRWLYTEGAVAAGDALLQGQWVLGSGSYTVTASDSNDAQAPPPSGQYPTDAPIPDIVLYRGWLFAAGEAPIVGTRGVVAHAIGCKLTLYFVSNDTGDRGRLCYLEGDPDTCVWVYNGVDGGEVRVPVGSFVEWQTDSSGQWTNWVIVNGEDVRTLDQLDSDSRHQEVMANEP